MKKLLFLTVFTLIILLAHSVVFADSSIPKIEPYNAMISNENGAEYFVYRFNGVNGDSIDTMGYLDYGTEIVVQSEEFIIGKYYCRFIIPNSPSSMLYYIALDDIQIKEESIINSITPDYGRPHYFTVIAEDGIPIHKGPALIYDVIGKTIPYDTKITAYGVSSSDDNPWYYITYEGVNGFISAQYGALGQPTSSIQSIKAPVDMKVYRKTTSNTLAGTIPANTVITNFMEIDKWSNMYYVYDGINGYVYKDHTSVLRYRLAQRLITVPEEGLLLYERASTDSEVVRDDIPVGTVLIGTYEKYQMVDQGWVNVKYEDDTGWILLTGDMLEESNKAVGYESETLEETDTNTINEEAVENVVEEIEEPEEVLPTNEPQNNSKSKIQIPTITIVCFVAGLFFIVGAIILVKKTSPKK